MVGETVDINTEDTEEERYVIAPKGIAWLCLRDANIEFTEREFDTFWILFDHHMREHGYVVEED